MATWGNRVGRRAAGRALGFEALEGRDLMAADPLPVLLVIADQRDFYYAEYSRTRAGIESLGVDVVVGAATTNPSVPHWGTWLTPQAPPDNGTIVPDIALADADVSDYSAIAFVGGWGASVYQYAYNDPNFDGVTDNYYSNPHYNDDPDLNDGQIAPQKVAANQLIGSFLAAGKPVAGLCHGVTVLAWARVDGASPLAGRQVAVPHLEGTPDQWYDGAWRSGGYLTGQRDQVIANGGLPTASSGAYGPLATPADDVIVDGLIITGENPASAPLFGITIAQQVLAALPPANQPPVAAAAAWVLAENAAAGTVVGTVTASDPDLGQGLTYAIVGGNEAGAFAIDPVTGQITVANPSALDFETTPAFQLTVRVTDTGAGPLSATAAVTVTLQDVFEAPPAPVALVGGNLVVTGTAGDDTVYLWSSGTANTVYAWVNGASYGAFVLGPGGRVVVNAGDGNDRVFATDLYAGLTAFGGAGHDLLVGGHAADVLDGGDGVDRLSGGGGDDLIRGGDGDDYLYGEGGDDIVLGGAGNDRIEGSDGRDLLVGGLGADVLFGGGGDNLLVGGTTAHDGDDAALLALHGVWLAPVGLDDRVAALTGSLGAGDDAAGDALVAGAGDDWLLSGVGDALYLIDPADRVSSV